MTSFLYPIHNRVDQNCFMTIGKGILKGQVPYRDLFDQKGPVIFFMHALASRISTTSFIGVYFLQYVFLIVFMIYTRKTACLFVPEKKANFIVFYSGAYHDIQMLFKGRQCGRVCTSSYCNSHVLHAGYVSQRGEGKII